MPNKTITPNKIRTAFAAALDGAGPVVVKPLPAGRYEVRVGRGSRRPRLVAQWIGEGWPARVRRIEKELGLSRDAVIVGEYFSATARDMLLVRGINWLETSGNARITTDDFVLVRSDHVRRNKSTPVFRWTPAALDVGEAILALRRVPRVRDLGRITSLSLEPVSRVLAAFDRMKWTEKSGNRGPRAQRRLIGGDRLLEEWARHVATETRQSKGAHRVMRDPVGYLRKELGPQLSKVGEWALSGWAAADLLAPHVTSIPVLHIYIEEAVFHGGTQQLFGALDVRPVDEGGRLEFWPGRPATFHLSEPIDSAAKVASHPRIYADLLRLGERGAAAAEYLREKHLSYG